MVAQTVPPLNKNCTCACFFYPSAIDGRVHVRDLFFAVRQPKATDTQGLYMSVLHFNTWELITGRIN